MKPPTLDIFSNTQVFIQGPNLLKCSVQRMGLDRWYKFANHYNTDNIFLNETGWDHLSIQRREKIKGLSSGQMTSRYLNRLK